VSVHRPALVLILSTALVAAAVTTALAAPVANTTYVAKGTELHTGADGTTVSVSKLPIRQKCKGVKPSNQGDFGSSGLGPFPVKADGTFTNGGRYAPKTPGSVIVKGKFSNDGTTVKGTVKVSAFKDSKGFDCKAFVGSFTAKRS